MQRISIDLSVYNEQILHTFTMTSTVMLLSLLLYQLHALLDQQTIMHMN